MASAAGFRAPRDPIAAELHERAIVIGELPVSWPRKSENQKDSGITLDLSSFLSVVEEREDPVKGWSEPLQRETQPRNAADFSGFSIVHQLYF